MLLLCYCSNRHKSSFLLAMNLFLHGFSCSNPVTKLCIMVMITYSDICSLSRYYRIKILLTILCPILNDMHWNGKDLTIINLILTTLCRYVGCIKLNLSTIFYFETGIPKDCKMKTFKPASFTSWMEHNAAKLSDLLVTILNESSNPI